MINITQMLIKVKNYVWKISIILSIKMIEPKLQYFHDSILLTGNSYGNSITGGVVYKNKKSIWHNHYFFADFMSSNIWYLDTN